MKNMGAYSLTLGSELLLLRVQDLFSPTDGVVLAREFAKRLRGLMRPAKKITGKKWRGSEISRKIRRESLK